MTDLDAKTVRLKAATEMQPVRCGILVSKSSGNEIGDKLLVSGYGVVQVIGYFDDLSRYPARATLAQRLLWNVQRFLQKYR